MTINIGSLGATTNGGSSPLTASYNRGGAVPEGGLCPLNVLDAGTADGVACEVDVDGILQALALGRFRVTALIDAYGTTMAGARLSTSAVGTAAGAALDNEFCATLTYDVTVTSLDPGMAILCGIYVYPDASATGVQADCSVSVSYEGPLS